MPDDRINRQGATLDGKTLALVPAPRLNLTGANDVRRELAKLYRDARAGRVQTADATRLAYILDMLRRAIETSDLENRITIMEKNT